MPFKTKRDVSNQQQPTPRRGPHHNTPPQQVSPLSLEPLLAAPRSSERQAGGHANDNPRPARYR